LFAEQGLADFLKRELRLLSEPMLFLQVERGRDVVSNQYADAGARVNRWLTL
jgi:hypothetical protein